MIDYKKIGFKCGLELHQQLDTQKLFCSCPSEISKLKPEFEIYRELISVAGETGKKDAAAEFETKNKKKLIYVGDHQTSCLVDTDGEPPHAMNEEALLIALRLSELLHMKPVDEIQVMRKTIADGSVITGFQRTAMVAVDGYVDSSLGKVRVTPLILEEDSCRRIEKKDTGVAWHFDRQGISLIELRTDPDIKNPEHAKEVAKELRKISHLVGVKRGIGTVRQDVNISVRGGNRVEIKGVQDIKLMPKVIEKEVERQLNLIKQKKGVELCVRKALPDGSTEYLRPMAGSARMYPETDVPPIKITKKTINLVKKSLPKTYEDIEKDLIKLGIPQHISKQLISLGYSQKCIKIIKDTGVDSKKKKTRTKTFTADAILVNPKLVAATIIAFPKKSNEEIKNVLLKYKNGKLTKEGIKDILAGKKFRGKLMPKSEVEKYIKRVISKNEKLLSDHNAFQKFMGLVMRDLRGKADGKTIAEILKSELK